VTAKCPNPVGKIAKKKQLEGVRFLLFGTQITMLYCQKYTPTDCFLAILPITDDV